MPSHAHPVLPLIPPSHLGVGFTPKVNFAEILFGMDVKKPLNSSLLAMSLIVALSPPKKPASRPHPLQPDSKA